jgi:hypothetical protein
VIFDYLVTCSIIILCVDDIMLVNRECAPNADERTGVTLAAANDCLMDILQQGYPNSVPSSFNSEFEAIIRILFS